MDIEQEDEEMRKIKEEVRKVYEEECRRNEEKLRKSEEKLRKSERKIEQFLIKLNEDARRSYELYKQSEEYKQREEREREYLEWQRKLRETPETDNGGEWLEAMWHEHERDLMPVISSITSICSKLLKSCRLHSPLRKAKTILSFSIEANAT